MHTKRPKNTREKMDYAISTTESQNKNDNHAYSLLKILVILLTFLRRDDDDDEKNNVREKKSQNKQ